MLIIVLKERVRSVSSSMPPGSMASSWSVSVTRMTASVRRWMGSRPDRAITQPMAPATSTASRPKVSSENARIRRISSVACSGRPSTSA